MVISSLHPCKQRVGPVPRTIIVTESPGIGGSKNLRSLRDHASASQVDITEKGCLWRNRRKQEKEEYPPG